MTKAQLAGAINGGTLEKIRSWERGRRAPDLIDQGQLAKAFGISLRAMQGRKDDEVENDEMRYA